MIHAQAHRGPDDQGRWLGQAGRYRITLGSCRLAILDLSPAGHQPMLSPAGRHVLTYNGEVYNYRELRSELEQDGVVFRGRSDTEVVLQALIRWGDAAPGRFNGMWALAWLDLDAGTLLLSRDPFGIKPLYYYEGPQGFYFGSEIKAILLGSGERFSVSPIAVMRYLQQSLLDAQEQTFFAKIQLFPPGHNMRIDLHAGKSLAPSLKRFWTFPSLDPSNGSASECIGSMREIFTDAVRLRLRSDVPVGVLLSGGLDSSSIATVMRSLLGASDGLLLISGVSEDRRYSEEPFIDRVSKYLGCETHKVRLRPHQAFDLLDHVTWFNDEPILSLSSVAHYQLMERAREIGIKVILSGQGADELLCGYDKYVGFYLQSLVRDGAWSTALRVLTGFAGRGTILSRFQLSEAKRYLPRAICPKEIDILGPLLKGGRFLLEVGLGDGTLVDRQAADISQFSIPALVHYEDRMSMACSREIRLPFLDPRLVSAVLPLPPDLKLRHGWTKWVLRKALEGSLPPEIAWRKDKQAFTIP